MEDTLKAFLDNIIVYSKQLFDSAVSWFAGISFSNFDLASLYTMLIRLVFPVLAMIIVVRCVLPLLNNEKHSRIWGYLEIPNNIRMPIKHWENSIGRSKLSDIVINLPFISRSHAVLTFEGDNWTINDLGSKGGVSVNGVVIDRSAVVEEGDKVSFAGAEFVLTPAEEECDTLEEHGRLAKFLELGKEFNAPRTLWLILIFQILGSIQIECANSGDEYLVVPFMLAFVFIETLLYIVIYLRLGIKNSELELLAYFLCGLDLLVVASAAPEQLLKQLIAIVLGIIIYLVLGYLINDVKRARKLKYVLVVGALILILLNLTLGEARFGARNWINLGFITFQPMEFVKVAFVLAGTATLDKLLTTRNMTAFIGFSGTCIGALVLMRDLGTAVIFFGAFLVVAFMRSGDIRTIAYISSGAVLGAFAVVTFLPYIASRFAAWGHVWEYADTIGYQQTRTMIAAASGGIIGVGGGNGTLVNVAASDTDLVFGVICEEWGLIIALLAVLIIVFFAIFAVSLMSDCKSSFYAIAACGAASIFLIQTTLNVFGSIDFLPLTGITLPFVSNGGSSMIVSWALLAFIKSADERTRSDKNKYAKEIGE